MKVKYLGKSPEMISEYNGKRYCFSKRNPIVDIPVEVYNNIQQSGHVNIGDICPIDTNDDDFVNIELKQKIKELEVKAAALSIENSQLKIEISNLKSVPSLREEAREDSEDEPEEKSVSKKKGRKPKK